MKFVVLNVPPGDRRTYKVWEEGKAPAVVADWGQSEESSSGCGRTEDSPSHAAVRSASLVIACLHPPKKLRPIGCFEARAQAAEEELERLRQELAQLLKADGGKLRP